MQVLATPIGHRRFTTRDPCMQSGGLLYEPSTDKDSAYASFCGVAVLDTDKSRPAVAYLGGQTTKKYFPPSVLSKGSRTTLHFSAGPRGHITISHVVGENDADWTCEATINAVTMDTPGSSGSANNPSRVSATPVQPKTIDFTEAFEFAIKRQCNTTCKDLLITSSEIFRLRDGRDVVGMVLTHARDHSCYLVMVQLSQNPRCLSFGFAVPVIASSIRHQPCPILMQTGNFFSLVIPFIKKCVGGGIESYRGPGFGSPACEQQPADKLKDMFSLCIYTLSLQSSGFDGSEGHEDTAHTLKLPISSSPLASRREICLTPTLKINSQPGKTLNLIGRPCGAPVIGFALRAEGSPQTQIVFCDIFNPKTGTTKSGFSQPKSAMIVSCAYHAPRQIFALLDCFGVLTLVQRFGGPMDLQLIRQETQWGMRYGVGKATVMGHTEDVEPASTKILFSYDEHQGDGDLPSTTTTTTTAGGDSHPRGRLHHDMYKIQFLPSSADFDDPSQAKPTNISGDGPSAVGPLLLATDGKYGIVFGLHLKFADHELMRMSPFSLTVLRSCAYRGRALTSLCIRLLDTPDQAPQKSLYEWMGLGLKLIQHPHDFLAVMLALQDKVFNRLTGERKLEVGWSMMLVANAFAAHRCGQYSIIDQMVLKISSDCLNDQEFNQLLKRCANLLSRQLKGLINRYASAERRTGKPVPASTTVNRAFLDVLSGLYHQPPGVVHGGGSGVGCGDSIEAVRRAVFKAIKEFVNTQQLPDGAWKVQVNENSVELAECVATLLVASCTGKRSSLIFDESAPEGKQLRVECLLPTVKDSAATNKSSASTASSVKPVSSGISTTTTNESKSNTAGKQPLVRIDIPSLLSFPSNSPVSREEVVAKDLVIACDIATAAQNIPLALYSALISNRFHAVETILELGMMGDPKLKELFGAFAAANGNLPTEAQNKQMCTIFELIGTHTLSSAWYRNESTIFGTIIDLRSANMEPGADTTVNNAASMLLVLSYCCLHCPKDILKFLSKKVQESATGAAGKDFYDGLLKTVIATVFRMKYTQCVQVFTTNDLKTAANRAERRQVLDSTLSFYEVVPAFPSGKELLEEARKVLAPASSSSSTTTAGGSDASPATQAPKHLPSPLVISVALALRFQTNVDFWTNKKNDLEQRLQRVVSSPSGSLTDEEGKQLCIDSLILLLGGAKNTLFNEEELQGLVLSAVQIASKPLHPNPNSMPLAKEKREPYEKLFAEILILSGIPVTDSAKMKRRCHGLESMIVPSGESDLQSRVVSKLTSGEKKVTSLSPELEAIINFAPDPKSVANIYDIFYPSAASSTNSSDISSAAFVKQPTKACLTFDNTAGFKRLLKKMGADHTTSKHNWFHQRWGSELLTDFRTFLCEELLQKKLLGNDSSSNAKKYLDEFDSPDPLMGEHDLYGKALFQVLCTECPPTRSHTASAATASPPSNTLTIKTPAAAPGSVGSVKSVVASVVPGGSLASATTKPVIDHSKIPAVKSQSTTAPAPANNKPKAVVPAATTVAPTAMPASPVKTIVPHVAGTIGTGPSSPSVNVSASTIAPSQSPSVVPKPAADGATDIPKPAVPTTTPEQTSSGPRAFKADQIAWWEEGGDGTGKDGVAGAGSYSESITQRLGLLAAVDADARSNTSYTDTTSATSDGRHGDPEGYRRSVAAGHGNDHRHHSRDHGRHRHGHHHHRHSHRHHHHHKKNSKENVKPRDPAVTKDNAPPAGTAVPPALEPPKLLTIPGLSSEAARAPLQLITPPTLNAQEINSKVPDPAITQELLSTAAPQLLTLDNERFRPQNARLFHFQGAEMRPAGQVGPDGLIEAGAPVILPPAPVATLSAPLMPPGATGGAPPPPPAPPALLTLPSCGGGVVNLDEIEAQRKKEKEERKKKRAEKRAEAEREGKPASASAESTPERDERATAAGAGAASPGVVATETKPSEKVAEAMKEEQMQSEDVNRAYTLFATEAPLPAGTTMVVDAQGQKHISTSPGVHVPMGAEGAALTPKEQLGFRKYVDELLSKSMFGTPAPSHPSIPNLNGATGSTSTTSGTVAAPPAAGAHLIDDYTARQQALFELQQASLQAAQSENVKMFQRMIEEMRAGGAATGLGMPPSGASPTAASPNNQRLSMSGLPGREPSAANYSPLNNSLSRRDSLSQSLRPAGSTSVTGTTALALADTAITGHDQKQAIMKLQNDVRDLQSQQMRGGAAGGSVPGSASILHPQASARTMGSSVSNATPLASSLPPGGAAASSVRPTTDSAVGAAPITHDMAVQPSLSGIQPANSTASAQTVNLVTPSYGAGTQTSPSKSGGNSANNNSAAQLSALATLSELEKMQSQLNNANSAAGAIDDAIAASREAMARHQALSGMTKNQMEQEAAISALKSHTANVEQQLRSELPASSQSDLYTGKNIATSSSPGQQNRYSDLRLSTGSLGVPAASSTSAANSPQKTVGAGGGGGVPASALNSPEKRTSTAAASPVTLDELHKSGGPTATVSPTTLQQRAELPSEEGTSRPELPPDSHRGHGFSAVTTTDKGLSGSGSGTLPNAASTPHVSVTAMPGPPSAASVSFDESHSLATATQRMSVTQLLQQQQTSSTTSKVVVSRPGASKSPTRNQMQKSVSFGGENSYHSPPNVSSARSSSAGAASKRKTSPYDQRPSQGNLDTDTYNLYTSSQPRLQRTIPTTASQGRPSTARKPSPKSTAPSNALTGGKTYVAGKKTATSTSPVPNTRKPALARPLTGHGESHNPTSAPLSSSAKPTTSTVTGKRREMIQKHAAVRLADVDSRLHPPQ